ncbi:nucleotidyltransferase [Staphylococcus sp. 17KM0847]|uniref:nucleotidyltransferase n=1 Tax=Staphylococcus sp. 17KM0847 TaxID=2583989 RepID=UPI0015DBEBD9|nr:nucleotidyltransferase [Staphylococcus sp. 17KM0847]QLK85766.1 nucleotidyltransferase [Staphylococcus sp. 17KM0847]
MKSVALITEYNPFHNGHLYHALTAKQQTGADVTIAIMSGHFVMRGTPALFNKFQRAQMAMAGVDLVVEMPLIGSLSSSDTFARTGIQLADYLSADALCFGSESGDIKALNQAALTLLNVEHTVSFQQAMKQGKSYARIVGEHIDNTLLQSPNNILAISYLKQLYQLSSNIKPYTILRQHTQHHETTFQHHTFASGSAIRCAITNGDNKWREMVPETNHSLFVNAYRHQSRLFDMLKLTIFQQDAASLKHIYTMSEGFEHRLIKCIQRATSYDDLMQQLKTKRYTYTHIQRLLMNVLLNVKQQDVAKCIDINAAHILAMSRQGQHYLKWLKQHTPNINIITNVNQNNALYITNEIKATRIYNILTGSTQDDFNTPVYIYS